MRFETYLFDMDGTLNDSFPGIKNSVQYAMERLGEAPLPDDVLKKFLGPPIKTSLTEVLGFSEEKAMLAIKYYRERYGTKGIYENSVIEGAEDLLVELKQQGRTIAVATSKPEVMAVEIIRHFNLTGYFDLVAGAEMDVNGRNKKADVIEHALSQLDASREGVVMIGDRHHDIEGAKAAGIASIGVLCGYGSREELEAAGADFIVEKLSQIKHI